MVANTKQNQTTQTTKIEKIKPWELKQYRALVVEIAQLQAEKRAIESGILGGINLNISSRKSGISDPTSALAGRLEYFSAQIGDMMNKLIALRMKIESVIETLDPVERVVVRMRYFEGKNSEEIGEKLSYSARTITRLHDKILAKIC